MGDGCWFCVGCTCTALAPVNGYASFPPFLGQGTGALFWPDAGLHAFSGLGESVHDGHSEAHSSVVARIITDECHEVQPSHGHHPADM